MQKKYIAIIIALLGVAAWIFIIAQSKIQPSEVVAPVNTLVSQVDYLCDSGKTINAKYYQGPKAPTPAPGERPTPTGSVEVVLSDGRQLTLSQTISASGVRYANSDESLIFWSKGNSVFVVENNIETYSGCIAISTDPGGLSQVYANATSGFSIRYPAGYTVDTSYKYQYLGPGRDIYGIKFIIPEEMATGTNLSSFDTWISVEIISDTQDCNAGLFLDLKDSATSTQITSNDILYSMASSTGVAAGNRYEEIVWALPSMNSCIGVRYFIHSMNIDNYPEGAVKEFKREILIDQFDVIRRSLILE